MKMNRKGQFSIIAALFVVVILISSVMVTFSAIRYGSSDQSQPQIITAVDETNLALKQVLGFTVGYFGSVMQVTGNSSYAYAQSSTYLNSGLANIANMNPEWDASFKVTSLSLNTNWFTNNSYSEGILNVTYNLVGLGITGIAYSASCALNVQILPSTAQNQVCLTVTQDENEPVVNLGMANFNFYRYQYSNLTWAMVNPPSEPISSSNGTYTIDIPSGINPQSYIIQVQDSRGIMVAASSFSQYTGKLTFNSTTAAGGNYVNLDDAKVDTCPDVGTHSNFAAQQQTPSSTFDTLKEAQTSTPTQNYYPTGYTLGGSTTLSSGSLTDLTKNNSPYMSFQSYPSVTQYGTITYDSSNSASTNGLSSLQWTQTTGSGSNRILLVSVDIFSYSGTPATVSSVTYGSTTINSVSSYTKLYSSSPEVRSYVYYLVNPALGANTVKVSFSGSTAAVCGSTTYNNVNQASPIYAENSATGSGTSQSSSSVTASGTCAQLLYGNIATTTQSNSYTVTDAVTQNNHWSNSASYSHGGKNYFNVGSGSDESFSTSGSVSLSWTTALSVNWAGIAILLQPTQTVTQEACQVIFSGTSNSLNWSSLLWAIDAESSVANTAFTFQLYNYIAGQYPSTGGGYMATTIGTANTNATESTLINANPTNFRTSIGAWQLNITATASVSLAFTISLDLARYSPSAPLYGLGLEEQWTNLNVTALTNPALCIYGGTMGSANLAVDVRYDNSWQPLCTSLVSGWNNMSINSYLAAGSTSFAIEFINNDAGDTSQTSWQVSSALLRPESDQALFTSLSSPAATVAVELLQNGTMIWLGQSLTLTTQTIPMPPVPVKAIHINETIDDVNRQVPFQIEDWASSYTVPLGLTNNATVFGNMQMVVFIVNTRVSSFTVWWNGSADAIQTPLAYTSSSFKNDNPGNNFLSNGQLNLQFGVSPFTATSTVVASGTSSTATFMQVNNDGSTYGSGIDYVVYNGVVRDIVQQEAEWGGGISQKLQVNSFDNTYSQWTTSGSTPYLDGNGGNQISCNVNSRLEGWFGFQKLSINTLAGVTIEFTGSCSGDDYIQFQVNDGVSTYGWFSVILPSTNGLVSYDLSNIITSVTQLNNLKVNIRYVQVGSSASTITINSCDLNVVTVPNVYSDIVLTLPANATYFTYQTSLMFLNSAQPRTISQLCPISLTSTINTLQTENGISQGDPVVASGTQIFNSSQTWIHHWSQFINGNSGAGAGIMFTDQANHMLYTFDSTAPAASRGALSASSSAQTISLLPVTLNPVTFQKALDVTWDGAVVTFAGSDPAIYSGNDQPGLWILAEMPPTITVTVGN